MPRKKKYDEDGHVIKAQRGRPKKDNLKCRRYTLRMTEEDYEMVIRLCNDVGYPLSDIFTEAVRLYSDDIKSQKY